MILSFSFYHSRTAFPMNESQNESLTRAHKIMLLDSEQFTENHKTSLLETCPSCKDSFHTIHKAFETDITP